jgi:hypothetical protein
MHGAVNSARIVQDRRDAEAVARVTPPIRTGMLMLPAPDRAYWLKTLRGAPQAFAASMGALCVAIIDFRFDSPF